MAHKILNAIPHGVGNILSSLYQKAAPVAKTILHDAVRSSVNHGVQNIPRHNQIGDNGHAATSSAGHLVKKKKRKQPNNKKKLGKRIKTTKKSTPKKYRKKSAKKGTSLPDVF
jgi:hypothetical protein